MAARWLLCASLLALAGHAAPAASGGAAAFGAANASAVLRSRTLTIILLHNRYCTDCQRLRRRLEAAAALHAGAGAGASSGGFAEADVGENSALIGAFALREVPAMRIHRSTDNLTWEYRGGLEPQQMAAHLAALVRGHLQKPRVLRSAADLQALTASANRVALVAGGPGAGDWRVAELLHQVADSAEVRELEPTGVKVGAFADGVPGGTIATGRFFGMDLALQPNRTATMDPALSLALIRRSGPSKQEWFGWTASGWPSALELTSWVAAHAAAVPLLVQLTPRSLTDELLEELRASNKSLLIVFGRTEEFAEGSAVRSALTRAAGAYRHSLLVGFLDYEAWPELAQRLRGARTEHLLAVIDVMNAAVLVDPAASQQQADAGSWLHLQVFCERFVKAELKPLAQLPFGAGAAASPAEKRDGEARIGVGWAGNPSGDRSHGPGVSRLFAPDFQSASLQQAGVAEQGGDPNVPTLVAFMLPWCGFSIQAEPLMEELSAVAALADLPVNVMRYDVTATNPLPDYLVASVAGMDALPQFLLFNASVGDSNDDASQDPDLPTVYRPGTMSAPLLMAFVVRQLHLRGLVKELSDASVRIRAAVRELAGWDASHPPPMVWEGHHSSAAAGV